MKKHQSHKALLLLVLGLFATLAWVTGYWPGIGWQLGGGHLWVTYSKGSAGFGPFIMWLRFALIAVIPWALIRPTTDLDWVFDIEKRWPKAREIGFGQADIQSPAVRTPGQPKIKRAHQRTNQEPHVDVNIQTPNTADTNTRMRVDGV